MRGARVALAVIAVAAALVAVWAAAARRAPVARGPIARLELRPADGTLEEEVRVGAIRFGQIGEEFQHRAAILVGSSLEVALPEAFEQSGWYFAGEPCGRILGVADVNVEGTGWSFEIVGSEDGGRTWLHLASIPKPHYTAYFEWLECEDGDVLALAAVFDTEIVETGGWADLLKNLVGRRASGERLFVWRSPDGGRTWRRPVSRSAGTRP